MFLSCPLKEGHGVKNRCQKFFRKTEFEKKGSKTHLLIIWFEPHIMRKQDRTINQKWFLQLLKKG